MLIPLAGRSPFFDNAEHFFPKPLTEFGGMTMIERVVRPLRAAWPGARFIFVVNRQDVVRFSLDATLRLIAGEEATIIPLAAQTQGALCSCLLSIDALNPDEPLVIANGDQVIDADLAAILGQFAESEAAAGVITFPSVHPRWSYVRLDSEGDVAQAAEKMVISDHAVAGFYYFRTARDFLDAAMNAVMIDDSVNGQFYIAPCLNHVLLKGKRVARVGVPAEAYSSFYSPQKIQEFVDVSLRAAVSGKHAAAPTRPSVVIPAAGEGSRFAKAGWRKPKPFIDVSGRPMIDHVIDNVAPSGSRPIILLRKEHMTQNVYTVRAIESRGARIVAVDRLTEGALCTVLLARAAFDENEPLLIANSDQVVDFDAAAYIRDCIDRDLDGSILVFRDKDKNPKWSFARLDAHGLVAEVAEKKPISDLATVGIYLFRTGRDFINAAVDMIARNERVNNEFYVCPVYNYMIAAGARIGVYEVSEDAMHGLGTPEDLNAHLKRIDAPQSADAPGA